MSAYGTRNRESCNAFANNRSQNCGNFITNTPTTRVCAPPGGVSSLRLGCDDDSGARRSHSHAYQQRHSNRASASRSDIRMDEASDVGFCRRPRDSANAFASGNNQNSGNVLTSTPTTRVAKPPGGASSICLGWGGDQQDRGANDRRRHKDGSVCSESQAPSEALSSFRPQTARATDCSERCDRGSCAQSYCRDSNAQRRYRKENSVCGDSQAHSEHFCRPQTACCRPQTARAYDGGGRRDRGSYVESEYQESSTQRRVKPGETARPYDRSERRDRGSYVESDCRESNAYGRVKPGETARTSDRFEPREHRSYTGYPQFTPSEVNRPMSVRRAPSGTTLSGADIGGKIEVEGSRPKTFRPSTRSNFSHRGHSTAFLPDWTTDSDMVTKTKKMFVESDCAGSHRDPNSVEALRYFQPHEQRLGKHRTPKPDHIVEEHARNEFRYFRDSERVGKARTGTSRKGTPSVSYPDRELSSTRADSRDDAASEYSSWAPYKAHSEIDDLPLGAEWSSFYCEAEF